LLKGYSPPSPMSISMMKTLLTGLIESRSLKGIAAYAAVLGVTKNEIWDFLYKALSSTAQDLSADEMVAMVLKAGQVAVTTMAALDQANTQAYGNPGITEVNIGVGTNPGILISGHDLKDMEELLEQTKGTGVDVYTHGEAAGQLLPCV